VVYHAWTTSRHRIKTIDPKTHLVEFTAGSAWPMGYWEKNQRYYVESIREALDTPGEFYLDRRAGQLLYYPRPDEDMARVEVVAPVLEDILRIEGDPAQDRPVAHLSFVGLALHHAAWSMPAADKVDIQAATFLPTAALYATGARDCLIKQCEIAHTGGYGLWLAGGSKNNRVEQCHLFDLGAGGVRLGETDLPEDERLQADHNDVDNCFIHDGGRVFHAGVGVWIGKSSHNRVRHNEICDLLYSGVSVGWSWGYAPSSAHHNLIEHNHIHHLGYGQLSDMGGIYHLGVGPGTVLRGNVIHDVLTYSYGGWGLYTDEGSTGVLIENNLVYRVTDGAFHQHYGRDNLVRNNVLALSATVGQVIRSREEEHNSFTLERNIIYGAATPPLGKNWGRGGFTLRDNLYWNTDPAALVFPGGRTLAQWQAAGHDAGSLAADPKFLAPDQADFRLAPDSPAFKLGFQPIAPTQAGLVGPPSWTDLPKQISRPEMKQPGQRGRRRVPLCAVDSVAGCHAHACREQVTALDGHGECGHGTRVRPTRGLHERLASADELDGQAPGVADEGRRVAAGQLDELALGRGARVEKPLAVGGHVLAQEGDVQKPAIDRRVIGHGVGRVAIELDGRLARVVHDKPRRARSHRHAHPEILTIPLGHLSRIRDVQGNVLDLHGVLEGVFWGTRRSGVPGKSNGQTPGIRPKAPVILSEAKDLSRRNNASSSKFRTASAPSLLSEAENLPCQ